MKKKCGCDLKKFILCDKHFKKLMKFNIHMPRENEAAELIKDKVEGITSKGLSFAFGLTESSGNQDKYKTTWEIATSNHITNNNKWISFEDHEKEIQELKEHNIQLLDFIISKDKEIQKLKKQLSNTCKGGK